jgi:putative spermidine/putrescine transport system substrate-binding protein
MEFPVCFGSLNVRNLLLGMLVWACAAGVSAGDVLRVLAWPGYADADLVKVFETRTGSKVEVTLIDSDEVLWQKLSYNQAQDFDVFAVNTAELQRYIAQKLVQPLNLAALPKTALQLPEFRDHKAIAGLVHGGKVFGIPYTYAEMGLIYDRKQVKQPPTSIKVLWDPQYQGKVLLYNGGAHNFSLAAQSLGLQNPFQLNDKTWPSTVQQLIALRRNALAFYTEPQESVAMFQQQGAALMFANYGSQQVQLLKNAGIDVGYVIPTEGALAWLDCWVMSSGAQNRKLAYAWMDYMLERGPSDALVTRQGLASTTVRPPLTRAGDRLLWLQPVENAERRNLLWERILSGDRAAKVLAP